MYFYVILCCSTAFCSYNKRLNLLEIFIHVKFDETKFFVFSYGRGDKELLINSHEENVILEKKGQKEYTKSLEETEEATPMKTS